MKVECLQDEKTLGAGEGAAMLASPRGDKRCVPSVWRGSMTRHSGGMIPFL